MGTEGGFGSYMCESGILSGLLHPCVSDRSGVVSGGVDGDDDDRRNIRVANH